MASYIEEMRSILAAILKADIADISIKATTTEGLGPEGCGEGISAHAVVLISKL
ncbi:MAG: 2-C-methyl-D-erythritol 2,4-cyclodiphosphate synthase [ANME-2 cluster archaeon]|nr:2-C-methyl-D-erythritol 2,4-cyclodiphosphate synthase [ANME-2 cluster archaeon]